MIRLLFRMIACVFIVLAISSCSQKSPKKRTAIFIGNDRIDQRKFDDKSIRSTLLDIVGSGSNSDTSLERYLREVEIEDLGRDLSSFIKSIENEESTSIEDKKFIISRDFPRQQLKDRLHSIGGFYAILALRAYVECVVIRGNRLKPGEQKIFGTIVDYAFNESDAKAHIDLVANHELTCRKVKVLDDTYTIHMSIAPYDESVEENGMKKHKRRKNGSFPGINGFLPNDPEVLANLRKMEYKLHAKGRSVDVIAAFKNGNILPKEHPIYEKTESNCVDIFFEKDPDPFELPSQHEYCMGRCKHPPLINTGH